MGKSSNKEIYMLIPLITYFDKTGLFTKDEISLNGVKKTIRNTYRNNNTMTNILMKITITLSKTKSYLNRKN